MASMFRWPCWAVSFLMLFVGGQTLICQAKSDPYRDFVGVWAGTILVNHEDLPKDVSLAITELPDGKGMLWDYTFGHAGQKGFDRASKVVVLLPSKSKMRTHWWGYRELTFETLGLEKFALEGFGTFSASLSPRRDFLGRKPATQRVTYRLEPSSFGYVWETTRDGTTSVWSQLEFTRTGQQGAPTPPGVQRKK